MALTHSNYASGVAEIVTECLKLNIVCDTWAGDLFNILVKDPQPQNTASFLRGHPFLAAVYTIYEDAPFLWVKYTPDAQTIQDVLNDVKVGDASPLYKFRNLCNVLNMRLASHEMLAFLEALKNDETLAASACIGAMLLTHHILVTPEMLQHPRVKCIRYLDGVFGNYVTAPLATKSKKLTRRRSMVVCPTARETITACLLNNLECNVLADGLFDMQVAVTAFDAGYFLRGHPFLAAVYKIYEAAPFLWECFFVEEQVFDEFLMDLRVRGRSSPDTTLRNFRNFLDTRLSVGQITQFLDAVSDTQCPATLACVAAMLLTHRDVLSDQIVHHPNVERIEYLHDIFGPLVTLPVSRKQKRKASHLVQ